MLKTKVVQKLKSYHSRTYNQVSVNLDIDDEIYVIVPLYMVSLFYLFLDSNIWKPVDDVFKSIVYTHEHIEVTFALIVAVACLLFIIVHRDRTLRETKGIDVWVVYATIGILVTPPFVPMFEEVLATTPANIFAFWSALIGIFIASALN